MRHRVLSVPWWLIPILIAVPYLGGLLVMSKYEFHHPGANITSFWEYDYFFWVTTPTLGFGDRTPVTWEGRQVLKLILLFGIPSVSIVITKLIELFSQRGRKIMNGKGTLPIHITDHTILFGAYVPGLTEQLITELQASSDAPIVLVVPVEGIEANPLPDSVQFFRGSLVGDDLFERSGFERAGGIVAFGDDDNASCVLAMTARDYNPTAHVVAVAYNLALLKSLIARFNRSDQSQHDVVCVPAAALSFVVDELTTPGSFLLADDLSSNTDSGSGRHHVDILEDLGPWDRRDVDVLLYRLGARFDAVGTKTCNTRPDPLAEVVRGGDRLFYVAPMQLAPSAFNWTSIPIRTAVD
ncbi:MAG TPA: ion channel [Candidatus Polarisedimenticolaceae bacterium]|nr:ion channel [Candidatus Polarisedimenticolaceae bacterium]